MKKIFFTIVFFTLLSFNYATAENLSNAFGANSPLKTVADDSGFRTEEVNVNTLFGTVVKLVLSLIGIFFLGLMIYGGFLWMTDRGNSDQVEKAKKLITAAIIGMIIVFSSYAISFFIIKSVGDPVLKEASN